MVSQYYLKSINIYTNNEALFEGKRRYASVFEKQDVATIYFDITLMNLAFGQADWSAQLESTCYQVWGEEKKQICHIKSEILISADYDIAYITDGWGVTKKGSYWLKGNYYWEFTLNGEHIGQKEFWILDEGMVSKDVNPYFNLKAVTLYEGGSEFPEDYEVISLTQFDTNTTRYIWIDCEIENKVQAQWQMELTILIVTQNNELKGKIVENRSIKGSTTQFVISNAWGGENPGKWRENEYEMQVMFMGCLIAKIPFTVADSIKEGRIPLNVKATQTANVAAPKDPHYEAVHYPTALKEHLKMYLALFNEFYVLQKNSDISFSFSETSEGIKLDLDEAHIVSFKQFMLQMRKYIYNKEEINQSKTAHSLENMPTQPVSDKLPDVLRFHIAKDDIPQVLTLLQTHFTEKEDTDILNEVILLSSSFNNISVEYSRDVIDFEDFNRQKNKITFALLNIVNEVVG